MVPPLIFESSSFWIRNSSKTLYTQCPQRVRLLKLHLSTPNLTLDWEVKHYWHSKKIKMGKEGSWLERWWLWHTFKCIFKHQFGHCFFCCQFARFYPIRCSCWGPCSRFSMFDCRQLESKMKNIKRWSHSLLPSVTESTGFCPQLRITTMCLPTSLSSTISWRS